MIIKYKKRDGSQAEHRLEGESITMGRSPDADIIVLDERASRLHCGIRFWEGDYYIKDLQSRNGTWVNGQKVEMQKINPGDQVRVGTSKFNVEGDHGEGHRPSTDSVNAELAKERESGKGFGTIMREIVDEAESDKGNTMPIEPLPSEQEPAAGATMVAAPKPAGPNPAAAPPAAPPKLIKAADKGNTFEAPPEVDKNTTMPIGEAEPAEKPKIKLTVKGKLAPGGDKPAPPTPVKKPPPGTIKLKKPGT